MRKQIPILFSTAMVQAILDGRKTMTRRIVSGNPNNVTWNPIVVNGHGGWCDDHGRPVKCRYGNVGDVLWVRETFLSGYKMEDGSFVYDENDDKIPVIFYKADGEGFQWYSGDSDFPVENKPWKPSIHMPKAVARIWLEVVNVRVERLHDISQEDAKAEGVWYSDTDETYYNYLTNEFCCDAKCSFMTLWEKINGKDSWDANPWVWVVEYKVLSTTGRPESL